MINPFNVVDFKVLIKSLAYIVGFAVLVIVIILSYREYKSTKNEMRSYERLYKAEKKQVEIWRDNADKWRLRSGAAVLEKNKMWKELRKIDSRFVDLHKDFTEVKKSMKNLVSYSNTQTQTNLSFTAPIKDTTYIIDSTVNEYNHYHFSDPWATVRATIKKDSVSSHISIRDSIVGVIYWDRSWFLGKKKYRVELKSHNPYTQISHNFTVFNKQRKRFLGIF